MRGKLALSYNLLLQEMRLQIGSFLMTQIKYLKDDQLHTLSITSRMASSLMNLYHNLAILWYTQEENPFLTMR